MGAAAPDLERLSTSGRRRSCWPGAGRSTEATAFNGGDGVCVRRPNVLRRPPSGPIGAASLAPRTLVRARRAGFCRSNGEVEALRVIHGAPLIRSGLGLHQGARSAVVSWAGVSILGAGVWSGGSK